jgi:hypothetical protein
MGLIGYVLTPQAFTTSHLALGPMLHCSGISYFINSYTIRARTNLVFGLQSELETIGHKATVNIGTLAV